MALAFIPRLVSGTAARTNTVPRSSKEVAWMVGGGGVALLLAIIGYFFFIGPQRSETSDVNDQAASAQSEDTTLQARIDTLRAQSKDLAKYQTELTRAELALPTTSGSQEFVRSLQTLFTQTHTNLQSLTVGEPAAVGGGAGAATNGTSTGGAATAPQAPAANPAPGAASAGGAAYSLAINVSVTGTPGDLNDFLEKLQEVQPRAVLVTGVTETTGVATSGGSGGASAGGTSLALTMQAFFAPDASASAPTTAPTSPSP